MGFVDRLRGTPEDRFARRVLTAMRDAGVAQARYRREQFAIEIHGGIIAYLGNLYRECERAPRSERRERIAAYLAAILHNPGAPATWDEVESLLRPLLRTETFGAGVPRPAARPLRRPAWPHLAEFVVVDQPTSIMYVTAEQASEWGVPEATVFARARRNLGSPAPGSDPADGPALVRLVESGDEYWASHLFVDGWLAAQAPRLGGRPVAFIPDTTGVLLVGDASAEGLRKVFELAEAEYRDAARPISPMAYTVDPSGAVVPFTVLADHPLYPSVHRAEVLLASSEYAAQADHLPTDAFVASCAIAQRPDGSVFSWASWAEDVDTLLPIADFVAFGSADGAAFFVPWAAVEREVDLEPEPDLRPVRYRLRTWPHPGVVARLRSLAETP